MALETSFEQPAPVRQVSQLMATYIKRLGVIHVEGEVAQLTRRQSWVYLTLRDTEADMSVQAMCRRSVYDSSPIPVTEGAKVVVQAKFSYYPPRGSLTLQVREVRPVGVGELLARIEQRRQLLAAEGLFDQALKKPLPFLPRGVAVVTGRDTAAEKDVLENARRRWPGVRIEVQHTLVQGPQAAAQVIEALQAFDQRPELDVIIVARGGGSLEDLLPFSDEGLIRAVHACATPVVSAIGHEPDQPLLDLVADVRASTPTDAAKTVVPDVSEELSRLAGVRDRARYVLAQLIEAQRSGLSATRSRPVLAEPHRIFDQAAEQVSGQLHRARRTLHHQLDGEARQNAERLARVRALSPLATLQRGYAVVQDPDGGVLTSTDHVAAGGRLGIRVVDGRIDATVAGVHPDADDPEPAPTSGRPRRPRRRDAAHEFDPSPDEGDPHG